MNGTVPGEATVSAASLTTMSVPFSASFHLYSAPFALKRLDLGRDVQRVSRPMDVTDGGAYLLDGFFGFRNSRIDT